MHFLIDYENVSYAGLEGTELLESTDRVSFFFGNTCSKIINYRMNDIEKSGCGFEICKLKNARKNALDFYIASKVGEIFAVDKEAKVAIISADKGFQSVIDYWKPRLPVANQLIRTTSIAKAIQCINGEGIRKKIVNDRMMILELQEEYIKYEERRKIVKSISDVLANTEYEHLIPQVADIVKRAGSRRVLYLNSLKFFGKKTGTDVYRYIKNAIVKI